jgi:hypothetical protein
MRYIQGILWLAVFGGLAWLVHSGQAASYTGRRGRGFAEMLTTITDKVGQNTVVIGLLLIGVALAIWAIRGDDDEDEEETQAS